MAVTSSKRQFADHSRAALQRADEQGLLCEEDVVAPPMDVGYRGPAACAAAGITYRQLDYWARTQLVEPSVAPTDGVPPLYSVRDVLILKVVKRLLDTGISLQQIRTAVHHLRRRGTSDLAQITLMSDGVSVYECTSPDEVVDLIQRGQGVFGIALGKVWREVESSLHGVPTEDLGAAGEPEQPMDELAQRRRRRTG
ncbi:MerR-like DNA binding protein [Murinocardiopsis flavida]|uniref:MerR-like DNA binding protein n=1 Tax=Murinocardiopsis flavida TaxID=645275 RepID=A0A2P8DSF1_9ACTN|nr:MerR family transcriptional regulator [Murinocardiopsis flavida]PSL00138.1 MerR-like DNA binding protein [Murinocardiopsis flavida]